MRLHVASRLPRQPCRSAGHAVSALHLPSEGVWRPCLLHEVALGCGRYHLSLFYTEKEIGMAYSWITAGTALSQVLPRPWRRVVTML